MRAGLVAAGLAACVVGLSGADAGVVWIVAGVWTIRSVWGSPPGYAWGLLCFGLSARWGTLSVSDVETAARIFGPGAAAGSGVVRGGMGVAIAAAVLSEARIDGLRSPSWGPRIAAFAALLAIVALAAAPGPGGPDLERSLVSWAAAGVVAVAAVLALSRIARRIPPWALAGGAAAGVATGMTAL